MAKAVIDLPGNVIKLGKDIIHDEGLRRRFDRNPVGVMKDYGMKLPRSFTNKKLKELKVKDVLAGVTSDRLAKKPPIGVVPLVLVVPGVVIVAGVVIAIWVGDKPMGDK